MANNNYQQFNAPPQAGFMNSNYQQPPGGYNQPMGGPTVNVNMGNEGVGSKFGWAEPTGMFMEKAIRQAFVSKVFTILAIQLVGTSILIGAFVLHSGTKEYFKSVHGAPWVFLGFGIFFVGYLVLMCCEAARRKTPSNFIWLSVMTIGYGLVAAITSCRYDTRVVLFAFIATAVSCVLIALFAKSTKFDMTNCGGTLCLLALAHLVIGMVLMLILVPMGYAKVGHLLFSLAGAMLASLYLIFDLQLIMGGRKYELSPEEYILGVVCLYVDIIQLFIYMLQIFNHISGD